MGLNGACGLLQCVLLDARMINLQKKSNALHDLLLVHGFLAGQPQKFMQ